VEFALLAEHDRFAAAHELDGRYHLAKLINWAFADPGLIHEEHREVRATLFRPDARAVTTDLVAEAAALWQRALAKGLIPQKNGAN
jgi:hypothetical protein